jgi:hypothetical protein
MINQKRNLADETLRRNSGKQPISRWNMIERDQAEFPGDTIDFV